MSPWSKEIWRLCGLVGLALLIGFISGQILACLIIALASYLLWHFLNIYRLEKWLNKPGKFHPPEGHGIWAEIFDRIYNLQKKNRDRKKKLAKYITRFKESTAAMPDATVVLNRYDQIEWINKAAQESLGLQPSKDIGQHLSNLIRHPAFIRYLNLKDYDSPLELPSPVDEQQQLSVRIIPYGQNQRLLIARDITRIKRLEQMRRDFVSNISHELRTPLTVLSGYVENLLQQTPDEATLQHALTLMSQQTHRMQHLTEDLMLLSSLENNAGAIKREVVNVAQMLASLREEAIVLSADKQHTIELEADENVHLRGNPKELDSTFTNLVVNAVNYTPAKGRITIRWYADDAGAHFEVEDTGIGIAKHHLARLTERFYRVDVARSRATGGSGLGLAIVKHAMQQNQGKLRIESELGRGSRFICDFPVQLVVYKRAEAAKSAGSASTN